MQLEIFPQYRRLQGALYTKKKIKCILKNAFSNFVCSLITHLTQFNICLVKSEGELLGFYRLKGLFVYFQVTLHAKLAMPNSQRYAWYIYMINIVGYIVFFRVLITVLNLQLKIISFKIINVDLWLILDQIKLHEQSL